MKGKFSYYQRMSIPFNQAYHKRNRIVEVVKLVIIRVGHDRAVIVNL